MVEQETENLCVGSPILPLGTIFLFLLLISIMKKSLLVALGLMSVLCLAACQKNPEPVAVDNGDEGETQVEA